MEQQVVLDRLTSLLKDELEGSLTGIYLHGSMAMGCFHPAQSDIDILVVVKARQSIACYKKIANKLMALEEAFNLVKGFELSVVLETYAAHFIYPTPFEFHYSSDHREKYSTDDRYFCGGLDDPDLAAHFVVLYDRGIVLFGDPIKQVFNPIDSQYYMESIKLDVDGAIQGITENPVYYVLNLARVLLYVKEGNISSKKEAGEWALNELPKQFEGILSQCLAQYEGRAECLTIEDNLLINYACYMLTVIEDLM